MKKIMVFLLASMIITSCQVSQNIVQIYRQLPRTYEKAPVYFYFQDETLYDTTLFVGTIDVPDMSNVYYSMYSIESDARAIGGNAIQIINYGNNFDGDYYVKPKARVYYIRNFDKIDDNLTDDEVEIFKKATKPYLGIYSIYQNMDYWTKYACVMTSDSEYVFVYYNSNDLWVKKHWKKGDVKARMKKSFTPGIFDATWYGSNKGVIDNVKMKFEDKLLHTFGPGLNLYLNMVYPDSVPTLENTTFGTGFALNENGYIMTCYHLFRQAKEIYIKGINGNFDIRQRAKLITYDKNNDLAVLKLADTTIKFKSIPYNFRKDESKIGDNVMVLGYPMTPIMGDNIKLTDGLISSESGVLGDISMYQVTAPIQPGNSGCPLFNKEGDVIGLINSKIYLADNVGYAIKTKYWEDMLKGFPSINYLNNEAGSIPGLNLDEQVNNLKKFIYIIEVQK